MLASLRWAIAAIIICAWVLLLSPLVMLVIYYALLELGMSEIGSLLTMLTIITALGISIQ